MFEWDNGLGLVDVDVRCWYVDIGFYVLCEYVVSVGVLVE